MTRTARVALVTGAGRGLGRAIALDFARAGTNVAVNVRTNVSAAEDVVAEIENLGARGVAVVADVADHRQVEGMFAQVRATLGDLSILVNNAGPRAEAPVEDITDAEWERVVGGILTGTFHCCRAAVPVMKRQGGGRIVSILGAIAHVGQPHRAHLAAAKAGVLGLTRALSVELGPSGITVNAVSPGPLDLPPPPGIDPQLRLARAAAKPVGRLGTVEEVAAVVSFLASPGAAFITGQTIGVNGGEVMLG